MIECKETDSEVPICPHCGQPLQDILSQKLSGSLLGKRYVYFCSLCKKVLGISHRKGYLAGS